MQSLYLRRVTLPFTIITAHPPDMQRRSDVSFWSHLGWDFADLIETSSRRHYWYVNETDFLGTLSRRLTGT